MATKRSLISTSALNERARSKGRLVKAWRSNLSIASQNCPVGYLWASTSLALSESGRVPGGYEPRDPGQKMGRLLEVCGLVTPNEAEGLTNIDADGRRRLHDLGCLV